MTNHLTFNRYDKVKYLKEERTEWTLQVRAQVVWKVINRQSQEFRGMNIIFIDDRYELRYLLLICSRYNHKLYLEQF